ncbi:hypothetical protein ACVWXO_008008 [Bradyrhizobium sp. LM2.7]
MTELSPYRSTPAPLTAGARFIRGFKRVGVVAATIVLLGGLVVSWIIAADAQRSAQSRYEQASCIAGLVRLNKTFRMKAYDPNKIDFEASGCPGYSFYSESMETILSFARSGSPAALEYAVQPFFVGAAISLACGFTTFVVLWLVGWLCAGFTRD